MNRIQKRRVNQLGYFMAIAMSASTLGCGTPQTERSEGGDPMSPAGWTDLADRASSVSGGTMRGNTPMPVDDGRCYLCIENEPYAVECEQTLILDNGDVGCVDGERLSECRTKVACIPAGGDNQQTGISEVCNGLRANDGSCLVRCVFDSDCQVGEVCTPVSVDGNAYSVCVPDSGMDGTSPPTDSGGAAGVACGRVDSPGIREINDANKELNCSNVCNWLASCVVNTGDCTGYTMCDVDEYKSVYDGCAAACFADTNSLLLKVAQDHTLCQQTIRLASIQNESIKEKCAEGARPGD